jgi:hypothetical protein
MRDETSDDFRRDAAVSSARQGHLPQLSLYELVSHPVVAELKKFIGRHECVIVPPHVCRIVTPPDAADPEFRYADRTFSAVTNG